MDAGWGHPCFEGMGGPPLFLLALMLLLCMVCSEASYPVECAVLQPAGCSQALCSVSKLHKPSGG